MWRESDLMKFLQWKTCCCYLMSLMLKFSWKTPFSESGDTDVFKTNRNKLLVSNIDIDTLILDMLHSYMSVVYNYHFRGVSKFFFVRLFSLLIFVAIKASKGTELQCLFTQSTLQDGRIEDHRMMCTRHLKVTAIDMRYTFYALRIYWQQ